MPYLCFMSFVHFFLQNFCTFRMETIAKPIHIVPFIYSDGLHFTSHCLLRQFDPFCTSGMPCMTGRYTYTWNYPVFVLMNKFGLSHIFRVIPQSWTTVWHYRMQLTNIGCGYHLYDHCQIIYRKSILSEPYSHSIQSYFVQPTGNMRKSRLSYLFPVFLFPWTAI